MAITTDTIVRIQVKNRAKLRSYIWAIVHDEHMADDVLQDVCALAITKIDQIKSEESLLPWMFQVARFEALNAFRKQNRSPLTFSDATLDLLQANWGAVDTEDTDDRVEALRACIEKLTPRARRLVTMRYVDGMTGIDMACVLDRGVKSIYVSMSRIHRTLADCIQRRMQQKGVVND